MNRSFLRRARMKLLFSSLQAQWRLSTIVFQHLLTLVLSFSVLLANVYNFLGQNPRISLRLVLLFASRCCSISNVFSNLDKIQAIQWQTSLGIPRMGFMLGHGFPTAVISSSMLNFNFYVAVLRLVEFLFCYSLSWICLRFVHCNRFRRFRVLGRFSPYEL